MCHEFAESCIQAENKLLELNERKNFRCVDVYDIPIFSTDPLLFSVAHNISDLWKNLLNLGVSSKAKIFIHVRFLN
jgi:hypothetical protein